MKISIIISKFIKKLKFSWKKNYLSLIKISFIKRKKIYCFFFKKNKNIYILKNITYESKLFKKK
jgi:hypothetical protein